jgi:hypothetical protein
VKYRQINGLDWCCVDRLSRQPLPVKSISAKKNMSGNATYRELTFDTAIIAVYFSCGVNFQILETKPIRLATIPPSRVHAAE